MERPALEIALDKSVAIKFPIGVYSINAIIAANTKFEKEFSTQVHFSFLTFGPASYHRVILIPKSILNMMQVNAYVDEVLRYKNHSN